MSIEWSGGLYALQTQLNMSVHPAGKTALQLQGRGLSVKTVIMTINMK